LSEQGNAPPKVAADANAAANSRAEAAAAAREKAAAAQNLAAEKAARLKQEKEAASAASAAREAKAKQAAKTVEKSKKSTTISLFGLGGNNADTVSISAPPQKQQPSPAKPIAPSGVPTISGWRLTGDGSISGRISGSPNFRDGEQVTTSQIVQGRIESGSVVKTGSGSRYFLA
jgi:hypothetical protein